MRRLTGNNRPSFFKVLIKDDFRRLIRLPRKFMRKHGAVLPKTIKLKISSWRKWDVKVEKIEGVFCLTQGWKKFSADVGLEYGEFLVFFLDGKTLEVLVFETTASRKELPAASSHVHVSDSDADSGFDTDSGSDTDDDEENEQEDHFQMAEVENRYHKTNVVSRRQSKEALPLKKGSRSTLDKTNPLYCEILLKLHHRSRITLLAEFARATGLIRKASVEMEYVASQYRQLVELDKRDGGRVDVARGWPEFRKANMEYQKRYSLEFKPTQNVIQVKDVED